MILSQILVIWPADLVSLDDGSVLNVNPAHGKDAVTAQLAADDVLRRRII